MLPVRTITNHTNMDYNIFIYDPTKPNLTLIMKCTLILINIIISCNRCGLHKNFKHWSMSWTRGQWYHVANTRRISRLQLYKWIYYFHYGIAVRPVKQLVVSPPTSNVAPSPTPKKKKSKWQVLRIMYISRYTVTSQFAYNAIKR